MELLMVSLMDRLGASVSAVNGLQTGARGSVAASGVGEITGATPVCVAVSRHTHLFLAPVVAAGVAPVCTAKNIYITCIFQPRGRHRPGSYSEEHESDGRF